MPENKKQIKDEELTVLNQNGDSVPLAQFVERGPAILVFLRQFG